MAPGAVLISLLNRPDEDRAAELLRWGADDFLEKPISPSRLLAMLNRARRSMQTHPTHHAKHPIEIGSLPHIKAAREDLAKAHNMGVPLLIEGPQNCGKTSLAHALLRDYEPASRVHIIHGKERKAQQRPWGIALHRDHVPSDHVQGDDALEEDALATAIVLKDPECLNASEQAGLLEYLEGMRAYRANRASNSATTPLMIVTCRGRLMDHVAAGRMSAQLGAALGVMPCLLPGLDARPGERNALIAQFRDEAGSLFGHANLPDLTVLLTTLQTRSFADHIVGLRRAVFAACLTPMDSKPERSETVQPDQMPNTASPSTFGLLPWLDQSGQFRTLKAIEADMIRLANTHFDGRLGRMAKALGLGRTTLYRRLQDLDDGSKITPSNGLDGENTDPLNTHEDGDQPWATTGQSQAA